MDLAWNPENYPHRIIKHGTVLAVEDSMVLDPLPSDEKGKYKTFAMRIDSRVWEHSPQYALTVDAPYVCSLWLSLHPHFANDDRYLL